MNIAAKMNSGLVLKYRPDVDGLRAIAVMSVVFFHAGISAVPGGYVGVDVFFVISGYLISLVISEQIEADRFTYAGFYERRIRRIAPALLVALTFTTALCYFYLMPGPLLQYSKSLVSALLSVSNFYFFLNSGYFEAPSANEPVLHTWSLAIEEQFYVFLPVLLVVCYKYARRLTRLFVLGLCGLSFLLSVALVAYSPETAFYMLPTRAWELLLGSIVALRSVPELNSPVLRNGASAAGLLLIAYPVFFYSELTPFPGAAALPPCLGAILIIAAGRNGRSLVGRLLSVPPVVFVGKISYSVYLFHWPVVLFQRNDAMLVEGPLRYGKIAEVIASLVLGTVSWRFVERPFRQTAWIGRQQVFRWAGAGCLVILAEAGLLWVLPSRYPPDVAAVAVYANDTAEHFRTGKCFISTSQSFSAYDQAACLRPLPQTREAVLIGDSHAAHLWYGLSHVFSDTAVLQATAAGCKPTIADAHGSSACDRVMATGFDAALEKGTDELLIAAKWDERDLAAVAATLDWAAAHRVRAVLFGPIPQYDSPLPRLLALSLFHHDPGLPKQHMVDEDRLDHDMERMAVSRGVQYISLRSLLCPAGQCVTAIGNVPLQFDYGHLTKDGSMFVAEQLKNRRLLEP